MPMQESHRLPKTSEVVYHQQPEVVIAQATPQVMFEPVPMTTYMEPIPTYDNVSYEPMYAQQEPMYPQQQVFVIPSNSGSMPVQQQGMQQMQQMQGMQQGTHMAHM